MARTKSDIHDRRNERTMFAGAYLVIVAFVVAQIFIGGTRLLYCIPACGLLGLAAIATLGARWKTSSTARSECLLATTVFCIYLSIRNRLSPVDYLARADLFIVLGSFGVYLITALFLARSKERMGILYAVLTLALAHSIVGAIQFKRGDQFMLLPWIHRMDTFWRASGFYISPNHYAGLLEVVVLLTLSLVFWGNLKTVARVLSGYAAACCLAGLVLSGSRGGYLSFLLGGLVLAVLSLLTLRKVSPHRFIPGVIILLCSLTAVGLLSCFLIFQSSTIKVRFNQIHDPENMRWLLWDAALAQFRLSPIWGTGSGTYLYYGRMFRDPMVQNDPIYVHNDYLHLLAEYGTAGAVLFLLFLTTHLIAGVRNLRLLTQHFIDQADTSDPKLALQLGAMSAIAAYMFHSLVDFNLHIPANAFLMAWIFGMVANPAILTGKASTFSSMVKASARIFLIGIAVVIFVYGLPKLPGEWYAELARVALRNHRPAQARAYAAQALKYEKRNPDIYYYAGEAARAMFISQEPADPSLGNEAVEMFQAGLMQFPDDVRTVFKLAETYDDLRQFDLAESQLQKASELDPNVSLLNAYYGMHYHAQGMLEEAEQQYQQALELDPRDQIARAGLDEVQKALKPIRDAQSSLQTPESILKEEPPPITPQLSVPQNNKPSDTSGQSK